MSHALVVFLVATGLVGLAGILVRVFALPDLDAMNLDVVELSRDFFGAAVAVFPTTLLLEPKAHKAIVFSLTDLAALAGLVLMMALWAKGDARYLADWRVGKWRSKTSDKKLGDPKPAAHPKRLKVIAFGLGNGLGLMVLFGSTALSHTIASA
jgi:hypothetical protein